MRRFRTVFVAFISFVVLIAGAQVSAASTTSARATGADNAIIQEIQNAKATVGNGESVLAVQLEGADIWVRKDAGVTSVVVTPAGGQASSSGRLAPLPQQGPGTIQGPPSATPQMWGWLCTAITSSLAGLIFGMGAAAVGALAVASFPEGAVIGGFFFTSAELFTIAGIAGTYSLLRSWLRSHIC